MEHQKIHSKELIKLVNKPGMNVYVYAPVFEQYIKTTKQAVAEILKNNLSNDEFPIMLDNNDIYIG